ncbi:MAG: hypothetical protein LBQ24_01575 [Candidatus Peribacteria bacterium]|nr:hypothetical protein [Candidatus Peribacteria bacterium]
MLLLSCHHISSKSKETANHNQVGENGNILKLTSTFCLASLCPKSISQTFTTNLS